MKNPLRKRALKNTPTHQDWVDTEKENLPPEELEKIRRMGEYGVEPERIEAFRKGKIAEYAKRLKGEIFRHKPETPELIFTKYGIKVYKDKYCEIKLDSGLHRRTLMSIINKLIRDYKSIIPNRKPKIIITNTDENPLSKGLNIVGGKTSPAGFYYSRIIYLDQYSVDNYEILVHEYAHFLTDRIPKQTEGILKKEYGKMLREYFGQKSRRQKLEGGKNEKHRNAVAEKLGLPTPYAATNFDEWFAELITHWDKIPNDVNGYRFKQVMKKVLSRV